MTEHPTGDNSLLPNKQPPPYEETGSKDQITTPSSKSTNDKDLFSAAEALTQLTNSVTPPLFPHSQASSPTNVTTPPETTKSTLDSAPSERPPRKHPIVAGITHVSKHPLVTNAVKYYENSKRSYPSFNYAAEFVEKAAIPVVNKIEVNLNSRHQARYQARKLRMEAAAAAAAEVAENTSFASNGRSKKRRLSNGNIAPEKVSDETKKRLQFCLHILRLANDHINNKVNFLQQKVTAREQSIREARENLKTLQQLRKQQVQEEEHQLDLEQPDNIEYHSADLSSDTAQETKTEIVTTVKRIIGLISNFKPSALTTDGLTPVSSNDSSLNNNELKDAIRDIILKLPASIQQNVKRTASPSAQQTDKFFVFAKESLDMISKLTNVFSDQLVKAEEWVTGEEEQLNRNESEIALDTNTSNKSSSEVSSSATEDLSEKEGSIENDDAIAPDSKRIKIQPS